MIKTAALILAVCATVQGFTAFAYNTDYEYIRKNNVNLPRSMTIMREIGKGHLMNIPE